MQTIYQVIEHDCDCGPSKTIAYFVCKRGAKFVINSFKIKFKMDLWEINEITVYGSSTDYYTNNPVAFKERALAKLTPEERKALGY